MNLRKTFMDELTKLAEKDKRVILIVSDVGFSYIEEFAQKFPAQFINAGVTEQSMIGMAAGLALVGFKPYVYSMIPFVTMRPYEQVRNDACYNDADVKLVGVQGSVHYKFLGFSHNIAENEDKKILDGLPNMTQHYPETEEGVISAMEAMYTSVHPAYIRV